MKSIVITGASRGLGREMAVYFSTNGWRVAGCGRDEGRIRELKKEIASPHRFDVLDVSDDAQVRFAHSKSGALATNAWPANHIWAVHGNPFMKCQCSELRFVAVNCKEFAFRPGAPARSPGRASSVAGERGGLLPYRSAPLLWSFPSLTSSSMSFSSRRSRRRWSGSSFCSLAMWLRLRRTPR